MTKRFRLYVAGRPTVALLLLFTSCGPAPALESRANVQGPELGRAVQQAAAAFAGNGLQFTSETALTVQLESPCTKTKVVTDCFLVTLTQSVPPRSFLESKVAELRMERSSQVILELKRF